MCETESRELESECRCSFLAVDVMLTGASITDDVSIDKSPILQLSVV